MHDESSETVVLTVEEADGLAELLAASRMHDENLSARGTSQ
ncbi:hypothetical protein [Actinomadura alba]|nr:hypothetical protein [Actinomadura alba]